MNNEDLLDPATGACVALNLRRAARWFTQHYEKHMETTGVKITQFGLLVVIDSNPKATINKLAEIFELDRTTLSRNLRPLERQGWITITPGDDKRVRYLALTKVGKEALERARPYWQAAQNEALAIMGTQPWLAMKDQLDNANEDLKERLGAQGA